MTGVPNCIFRGYPSLGVARAAFDYAQERSWIRNVTDATTRPISALPQPITAEPTLNSLNRSEGEDNRWYVVYRGICPGVYRSQ